MAVFLVLHVRCLLSSDFHPLEVTCREGIPAVYLLETELTMQSVPKATSSVFEVTVLHCVYERVS